MSNLQVSRQPAIAAQQLAIQREHINSSPYLTPEAKSWHIQYLERAFANAQYGQTLSWPTRIAWAIGSIPASLAWSLYNFPDIVRYGMLGGSGGLLEVEGGRSVERLTVEEDKDNHGL